MQHHPRRPAPSYKANFVNQKNTSKFALKQRLPISYEPAVVMDNYEDQRTVPDGGTAGQGGPLFVNHNHPSLRDQRLSGAYPQPQQQQQQQQASIITFGAPRNDIGSYPHGGAPPQPPLGAGAGAARASGPWVYEEANAGHFHNNNNNNNNNNSVFVVDGSRTGEEVLVNKVQPRQPVTQRRGSNSSHNHKDNNSSSDNNYAALLAEVEALKKKLAQANAERKAQTEKMKTWKKDMVQQQQALLSCVEEELLQRRKAETELLLQREKALQQLVAAFATTLAAKLQEIKKLELQYRNEKEKQVQLADRQDETMARARAEWEAAQQKQERDAESRAQSTKAAAQSEWEKEVARLKKEMAEMQTTYERRIQQLEAEKSGTEEQLIKQITLVKTLTDKQAQDAFLVAQCRRFVHAICQPGYSVVKGTNLEPVEKDRPEPTGYVLVPLIVLLHGYTLLPEEERRGVVEQYDEIQSHMK